MTPDEASDYMDLPDEQARNLASGPASTDAAKATAQDAQKILRRTPVEQNRLRKLLFDELRSRSRSGAVDPETLNDRLRRLRRFFAERQ